MKLTYFFLIENGERYHVKRRIYINKCVQKEIDIGAWTHYLFRCNISIHYNQSLEVSQSPESTNGVFINYI